MFKKIKIPYIEFFPIILLSLIALKIIFNFNNIFTSTFGVIFSILTPFIWAFAFAYLLNPSVKFFERKFKFKKSLSIVLTYVLVIGLFTLFITVVVPALTTSMSDLFKELPQYINDTEALIKRTIDSLSDNKELSGLLNQLENIFTSLLKKSSDFLNSLLGKTLNKTIQFTSSFIKALFGFIISIYMIMDKDKLKNNIKNFIIICFGQKNALSLFEFGNEVDSIFLKFIIGKFWDSVIIGILCFIGLLIIKSPFTLLISLIVGITNMIPYFGPLLGMIPAFFLTLIISPTKAILVLLFILLLQQFDGWYLGPKILGQQVGLSPFWIILAITIGGGLFGVIGMFLSVPIMAVISIYLNKFMNKKLLALNSTSKK